MSKNSKVLLLIVLLVITIGGVGAGVFLVQKNQELRKEAAIPTGVATITLSPPSASYVVGDSFLVNISFNTSGVLVSGISVRAKYQYSGIDPEVSASDIQINPALASAGFTCPIKQISTEGNLVNIDVVCITTGQGLTTTTTTSLATFTLQAESIPAVNPVVVSFDATKSFITKKSGIGEEAEDILLTPSSTGSYTILAAEGGGPTSTPTPTTTTASGTSTPTPTLASGVSPTSTSTPTPTTASLGGTESTPTPTVAPSATKTPTPTSTSNGNQSTAQLPDSGVSLPFILLSSLGILVLVFAALLVI